MTLGGRTECRVEHEVFVAHNPYAECPVDKQIWGGYPQLVHENDQLFWTDGHPAEL
jgi:hypothetical protein